ncbi:hypothetical protein G173_gp262 [Erwinia phage phiEaH2]|uniref:Uncharacterized protein n=1 Tax=Erwinia phage phiEaH2 TaxID=1029988 RepID=J7KJT1_9CAUD|nr:hypothetical protein G173_gp262 [Erwinia phage phiEaH2]AFQ96807.1 hypothetical protein [Erwinia phage phiEaH2]
MAFRYELKHLDNIKRVFGGMMLEFNTENYSFRPPVFLSSVKFDLLHNFIELQLRQMKGDFGKYKDLEGVDTKKVTILTFSDKLSFLIGNGYSSTDDPKFEQETIASHTKFMELTGLYRPGIAITDLVKDHNLHRCSVVRLQHCIYHPSIPREEPLVELRDNGHRDMSSLLHDVSRWYSADQDDVYGLVVKDKGDIAALGHLNPFTLEHQHNGRAWVPIRPLPETTSNELSAVADVLGGIANMGSLPEHDYHLKMVNGLGEVAVGRLTKQQIMELANRLIK